MVLLDLLTLAVFAVTATAACPSNCTCRGDSIDCSGRGYFSFPQYVPSTTKELRLSGNNIVQLRNDELSGLRQLTRLDLAGNPVRCDCEILWLLELAQLPTPPPWFRYLRIACASPSNLRGRTLGQLRVNDLDCEPPRIVLGPGAVEATAGNDLTLTCQATGSPTPRVTFRKNGLVVSSTRRHLVNSNRLRIQRVTHADIGYYHCEAVNKFGVARSSRAKVDVTPRRLRHRPQSDQRTAATGGQRHRGNRDQNYRRDPSFLIRPHDVSISEGDQATFKCQPTGTQPIRIEWYYKDRFVRPDRKFQIDQDGTFLTVSPILESDAGVVSCRISNTRGQDSATATVTVRSSYPPVITTIPSNIDDARLGRRAEFECEATGTPLPRITWHFNGVAIPRNTGGRYTVQRDGTLVIHRVTVVDVGYYTCQAANNVGAQSAEAHLKIKFDDQQNPIDENLIRTQVEIARQNVDNAISRTQAELFSNRPKTPAQLLALFRYPARQALEQARVREIYEQTLALIEQHVSRGLQFNLTGFTYQSLLDETSLELIADMSGCFIHRVARTCDDVCFHRKYRTYDGTCNNLQNAMWGASFTPLRRMLPPIYENGFNMPVGWTADKEYYGFPKPNVRAVSAAVIHNPNVQQDDEFTHMLMQWGQFLDHDIDFSVAAPSTAQYQGGADCSQCSENRPPCFNIAIPPNDRRSRQGPCMPFERTSAVCGSGETSILMNRVMPREQVNAITSYVDASNVYGNNDQDAHDLRDLQSNHGLLKFELTSHKKKPYLPPNKITPMDCQRNTSVSHSVKCFLAGDYRANEQLGLLAMHTVWLREHNRMAAGLLVRNPHWDGEAIYQETRKIVGAMMQHITMDHWLPIILGPQGMRLLGQYRGYNPAVDASVANAFATAAFRFGHSLVNPVLYRLNASFLPIPEGNLPLHEAFFAPERLLREGGVDPLLRGLFGTKAKKLTTDAMLNRELVDKLFSRAHQVSLDLASLNLQRGRDHALPGYLEYRRVCNLTEPDSFDRMQNIISDYRLRELLKALYGHPGNMDIWIAGMSEDLLPNAKVGPVFACIIADTFKRIRDGDRFWYENADVFTPVQLAEIKRTSLAGVICNSSDEIAEVQRDVFRYATRYENCKSIPTINLDMWTECCSGCNAQASIVYEDYDALQDEARPTRQRRAAGQCDKQTDTLRRYEERLKELEERIAAIEENGTSKN